MRSSQTVKTPGQQEDRKAERIAINAPATLREHGSSKFNVMLVDLSVTGFRFKTLFFIKVGKRIWITIPGLASLEARIAWHDESLYGAALEHSLHPAVRDHIVRQFKVKAG